MNPLNHVAIIMDGNGRWGLKHKNSRNAGHRAGLNTVERIIKQSIKNKIKFLTLFAFSTENWKRPKKEINYLFNLLENFLTKKIDDLNLKDIGFIKIDAEGAELKVLIGAKKLIKKYKPTLLIEIEERYISQSIEKTLKTIRVVR